MNITSKTTQIDVKSIFNLLLNDGVVVLPSSLGYAILAVTKKGIKKLYKLKERPNNKPSGIIATPEIFNALADSSFSHEVAKINYPVGFIERVKEHQALKDHYIISGDKSTLGFFLNLNKLMTQLCEYAWEANKLITISSANKTGQGNALHYAELHSDFKIYADYLIDKEDLTLNNERKEMDQITSTIIDLTKNEIFRRGVYADRTEALAREHYLITETKNSLPANKTNHQFASCMFMLAYKKASYRIIQHAKHTDWLVLDLEDGCPADFKEQARSLVKLHANADTFNNQNVLVRLNELHNYEELEKDLKINYTSKIKGFALPMLRTKYDVEAYERKIDQLEEWLGLPSKFFKFFPIIETVEALNNAVEIAKASSRNIAMFLGHADLFNETLSYRTSENLQSVRFKYLCAAKEAGLAAFDTPYENVKDLSALETDALEAKRIGLDGKVALNYMQLNTINKVFRLAPARKTKIENLLGKYSGGCQLIDGEFIAPPIIKKMSKELKNGMYSPLKTQSNSVKGKTINYGLNYKEAYPGQIVPSPYETTVDESWITSWQAMVQTGNPLETSMEFCREMGLEKRLIPFECLVNLGLCLAVESFSEGSLFHLGISDVVYEKPAYVGDTIRSVVILDDICPASNGKYSVFKTRMILLNQNNERVVSMNRNSLFPFIKAEAILDRKEDLNSPYFHFFSSERTFLRERLFKAAKSSSHALLDSPSLFSKGELILHSITRPMGLSNSLAYSTLYKNTHPLHINSARYGMDGLVVCGGFIIPIIHASASRDIRFALDHEIIDTMHINKIHHEDAIGAMSYIIDSLIEDGIECLTVRTFGLKNLDAERDLAEIEIPIELLASPKIKPSEIELLCRAYVPELQQKICARMTWKLWRKA